MSSSNRRVEAYLTDDHHGRLQRVLTMTGQGFTAWLRMQIVRCSAERIPESQGDVKKVIPGDVAASARESLEREANFYLTLAAKVNDQAERKRLRQAAAIYLDAADWFANVLEERRQRVFLLESGQRTPRHRRKGSENPATVSSS